MWPQKKKKIHVHARYVITKLYGTVKIVMKELVTFALWIETGGGSSSHRMEVKFLPGYMSHPTWQSS